jgi:hypothetical protein
VSALATLLRWASVGACALVVLGFLFFAFDEAGQSSSDQVARVDGTVPATGDELQREQKAGGFREFVNDANDVLLGPFDSVVTSSDAWVTNGVPALLAVLLYGLGGLTLLNYLLPARR